MFSFLYNVAIMNESSVENEENILQKILKDSQLYNLL